MPDDKKDMTVSPAQRRKLKIQQEKEHTKNQDKDAGQENSSKYKIPPRDKKSRITPAAWHKQSIEAIVQERAKAKVQAETGISHGAVIGGIPAPPSSQSLPAPPYRMSSPSPPFK